MENRKFLYFIIFGLLVMFASEKIKTYFIYKYQVVYIRFDERILVLPNNYYIDAFGKNELTFQGKDGTVVLSKEMPQDTLEYFEKHLKNKSEKCGMKMLDGQANGRNVSLVRDGKMSLLFVDVPLEVETAAFTSLCEPRKAKAQPTVPSAPPPPTNSSTP